MLLADARRAAEDIVLEARFKQRLGMPVVTKRFARVAATAIARIHGQNKPQRTALASRCLTQADALIRNVGLGKFPCLDFDPHAVPRAMRQRGPRKRMDAVS